MDILSEAGKFAKEQYQLNDPLHQWTHNSKRDEQSTSAK